MELSRFLPFVGVAVLSVWAIASTEGPPPLASPVTPTPRLEAPERSLRQPPTPAISVLVDAAGRRTELQPVRDNRGDPWFARNGTALWTRTTQGLALVALDGRVLERIPGATDIRETPDGNVRAHRVNDDWLVTTPRGTRRLLGPLTFPSLSPDGRYFAFELLNRRSREVHLVELRTGDEIEVARGLGQCHCTATDAYGLPEWSSDSILTFRDAGDFLAPPEEHETGARFEFDVDRRVLTRVGEPAAALTLCYTPKTLRTPDGTATLEYRRVCTYLGSDSE